MTGLRENHVCAGIFGNSRIDLLHIPQGGSTWGSGETYACRVEVGGCGRLDRIEGESIVSGDLNPIPIDVDDTAPAASGEADRQYESAWQVQLISSMR